MNTIALLACGMLAVAATAACSPADQTDGNDAQIPSSQIGVSAQTSFTLADQDDDGFVSREEASTVDGLDFTAADADRNAQLSPDEYQTAMEKARPRG
jgi:hypothetical protein